MLYENITEKIINTAISVHKELGPGLLERAYCECLSYEFKNAGLNFKREVFLPVVYQGMSIDCNFRIDFLIENKVIIEIKSVENIKNIHKAQLMTYMKLSGKKVGLLINFNTSILKNGIKRLVL